MCFESGTDDVSGRKGRCRPAGDPLALRRLQPTQPTPANGKVGG